MQETTTTIGGYKVQVFKGYYGTQLFITDAKGVEIYAHKVSGDPIARARQIILGETPESMPETANSQMINLSERKAEFKEAMRRGLDENLEVYPDFERDSFVVVNRTKETEYRVRFENENGRVFSSCSCPDFTYRKRICKHQTAVLEETFFGVCGSFGVVLDA